MADPVLVLASQSPRRQEILERAGFRFEVRLSGVEEVRLAEESPEDYVRRLSREKALSVSMNANEVVVGADTVVVVDRHVLEKPASNEDAARMLALLSGRNHFVLTGITLRAPARLITDVASTRVRFLPLSADEISAYVATGEPVDKAGAYAIQGYASKFVESIEGCYFNVVGFPVSLFYQHWKALLAGPPLE